MSDIYKGVKEVVHTIASLKGFDRNMLYVDEHGVNESDVSKVNSLVTILERDLKDSLVPGVVIICKGENKTYQNGALDCKSHWNTDDFNICTVPFAPSVYLEKDEDKVSFSPLGGGYWFTETEKRKFKYTGTRRKVFNTWGHCGACCNGLLYFEAIVGVWELESTEIY